MRNTVLAAAISAGALACVLSSADAGTLIPVPQVPGSSDTHIIGINDNNMIAGYYEDAQAVAHGFVGTLGGQYTLFDAPGGVTVAYGINNGGYTTVLSAVSGLAYLRSPDGSFTPITKRGAPLVGTPGGIIGHQNSVGHYFNSDTGSTRAYYAKGTRYRFDLQLPFNTDDAEAWGLNKAGAIVGIFRGIMENFVTGFVLENGVATALRYPDPAVHNTQFRDINRNGLVSGSWSNSDGTAWHAFLYDTHAATFLPLDVSGATNVFATAINSVGVVAVDADSLPYIYCTRKKTCPLNPAKGVSIPEKWVRVPAANIRTVLCKNSCRAPLHESASVKPADVAAMRAAVARDPELQSKSHSSQPH